MPEVHSSMRMVGTRVRGLSAAAANDEPLRLAEAGEGAGGHRGEVTVAAGMQQIGVGRVVSLLQIATTVPARVRIYGTDNARSADADRPAGTLPPAGSGCMLEFITTTALLSAALAPTVTATNLDTPVVAQLYCNVEPGAGIECTTSLTYLKLE